jgi:hypothetical protein
MPKIPNSFPAYIVTYGVQPIDLAEVYLVSAHAKERAKFLNTLCRRLEKKPNWATQLLFIDVEALRRSFKKKWREKCQKQIKK